MRTKGWTGAVVLAGALVACSNADTVSFPQGTGQDDPGEVSPESGEANDHTTASDAGTQPQQDDHDAAADVGAAPEASVPEAAAGPEVGVVDGPGPWHDAAEGGDASVNQPVVVIASPEDGAVVDNPVTFQIAARNVAYVRLFADGTALGDPWVPGYTDTFDQEFPVGIATWHVRLVGLDAQQQEIIDDAVTITVQD